MSEDGLMDWLEAMRSAYNPPPETPHDEIWDGIESTLDSESLTGDLARLRDGYRPPPPTPKEEMWSAIEAALPTASVVQVIPLDEARRRGGQARAWLFGWPALATAAAALLALGIGLGRVSVTPVEPPAQVASTEGATPSGARSYRAVAEDYLSRTESFLALVRSDSRSGSVDGDIGPWSKTLLLQTRLLLDSPAARDPIMRDLLEDLEVILIQVARLSPQGSEGVGRDDRQGEELDLINEGLQDNDVMMRIRSVIPAVSIQAGI